MFKFALAISIVCLQSLSISAGEDGIQLGWLATGKLIHWGQCDRGGRGRTTGGALDLSYHSIHSECNVKCKGNHWMVDWDKDDLGKSQNNQNCLPASASNQIGDCKTCSCINPSSLAGNLMGLNRFSLRAQESDVANNKVVTGVRFVTGSRAIYLQIEQATLQANGEVKDKEWVPVTVKQEADYQTDGAIHSDEFLITAEKRTVHLDKIIIPSNFYFTAVRFTVIKSGKGIQLEVRGTSVDGSGNLDRESHIWFDSSRSMDASYYRKRKEIELNNSKDSPLAPSNEATKTTNQFVKFRAADINDNMSFPTIPRLSTTSAVTGGNTAPQAMQLLYQGHAGYGGYLTLKVSRMVYVESSGSQY